MKPSVEWRAGSTWSRRIGARTRSPQSPITTLGIAASVSTRAVTGPRIPRGASSLRKSAMPSAIGVARISAEIEVTTVPNRKLPAPNCRRTGSQATSQTKLSPKVEIESRAPSITFQTIRPTSTRAPRAAIPALPCSRRSPRRARRPGKGRRAASVLTSREVTTARALPLRVDLPDLLLVERHDRLRKRLEHDRRPVLLALRDRPPEELLDVGGVGRVLLHVHVRVGADRVRIRVLLALRRIDDGERAVLGGVGVECGSREDRLCPHPHEVAGTVLHLEQAEVVVQAVVDVGVTDRAGGRPDRAGHAGAALLALTGRPADSGARPDLRLPRVRHVREVVGEVVRIARTVGAVHDRDRRVRKTLLLVQLLDRRRVPPRDLPHVDLREDRAGHVDVRETGQVVHRAGCRERPGDLHAARAARVELRERRVAGAEVHLLVRDRGDSSAGADRVVVELEPELLLHRALPLRQEWGNKRAPRAADARAAAIGGRRAGRGPRHAGDRRCCRSDEGDANELAVSRHLDFPPPQGSPPTYGAPRGAWDTPPLRGGVEVVTAPGATPEAS